jgi:hypothetical protein
VILGASYGELGFVALLLVVILLSQVVPRLGEAIGARFEKPRSDASNDDRPRA